MAGRKTKLTDDRQKLIVDALRAGNYIEAACGYSGISVATFYNWIERGEAAKSGRFLEFSEAVKKARAEAEMRDVQIINKAANSGTWQAAAWKLERSYPNRWGKRVQEIKHEGEITIAMDWGDNADIND